MKNVNTQEHPEHSEHSNIHHIVHVIELSQGQIQPFHSTTNIQPFLYRNTRNNIDRSEERMLPHVEEVAFLSPFTRSVSRKTLANSAKSKYRIINATILFLPY